MIFRLFSFLVSWKVYTCLLLIVDIGYAGAMIFYVFNNSPFLSWTVALILFLGLSFALDFRSHFVYLCALTREDPNVAFNVIYQGISYSIKCGFWQIFLLTLAFVTFVTRTFFILWITVTILIVILNFLLLVRKRFLDHMLSHMYLQLSEEEKHPFVLQQCCICLQLFEVEEEMVQLSCLHVYHRSCIQRWFRESPTCPICRFRLMDVQEPEMIL